MKIKKHTLRSLLGLLVVFAASCSSLQEKSASPSAMEVNNDERNSRAAVTERERQEDNAGKVVSDSQRGPEL